MTKLLTAVLLSVLFISGCQDQTKATKTSQDEIPKRVGLDSLVFQNDTLAIYQVDSISFFEAKATHVPDQDTLVYFEDMDMVKQLLRNKVTFGGVNEASNKIDTLIPGLWVAKILFQNGDSLLAENEDELLWMNFVRYYPSEQILLMEGGHSSDYSFDLKNGNRGADKVGNPDYIVYSPSKQFRLNGWFPGQECSDYFLQIKKGTDYVYYSAIPMDLSKQSFDLCTIKDIFWQTDEQLYFRNTFFTDQPDSRLGFFRMQIKK